MKTIKFLCQLFAATIFSFNFSACGGDDSDSSGMNVDSHAKHITRIFTQEGTESYGESIFSYDSQGRVTELVTRSDSKTSSPQTYAFTYGDNTITVYLTGKNIYQVIYIYSLQNGRITSLRVKQQNMDDRITSYTYDEQGQLKSENSELYTWTEGNLTKIKGNNIWHEYEYNQYTVPANCIPFHLFGNPTNVLAMQGLFGKMPKNLVSKYNYYNNSSNNSFGFTYIYTYQMKDGRPVKIDYTRSHIKDGTPSVNSIKCQTTIDWE